MKPVRTATIAAIVAAAAVAASPNVAGAIFASPLSAGCYIIAPNQCRIHIEPVTVNILTGQKLESVQLVLDGNVIYDFATDFSNKPPASGDTYTLSPVAVDFGAACGKTHQIHLRGRDTGDSTSFVLGQTSFTCPNKNALKPPKP